MKHIPVEERSKLKISAIVPVFDEERTVKKVVDQLLNHPQISEVVCVNDASTDASQDILESYGKKITLVNLPYNHGKGYALAAGIKKAKGAVVLFIDADLTRFYKRHLDVLIKTMQSNNCRAVLGYPVPSKYNLFAKSPLSKNVTGERAYYKADLLPHLIHMARTKFGVEMFLNNLFLKEETKQVPLRSLSHLWKHEKHTPKKAIKGYIRMGSEVAQEIGRKELREHSVLAQVVFRIRTYYVQAVAKSTYTIFSIALIISFLFVSVILLANVLSLNALQAYAITSNFAKFSEGLITPSKITPSSNSR